MRGGAIAWSAGRSPGTSCPAEAPINATGHGRFYERFWGIRQARTRCESVPLLNQMLTITFIHSAQAKRRGRRTQSYRGQAAERAFIAAAARTSNGTRNMAMTAVEEASAQAEPKKKK